MKCLALVVLAGCALTSKAPPLEVRYFSPEQAHRRDHHTTCTAAVRIGRVTTSDVLRRRIVHRQSAVEVAPYDTLRWTELPEEYVRRAIAHALFDDRSLVQAVGAQAPTLDVEVVAFEEVPHGGRVELRYVLSDDAAVRAHGVVAAERAVRAPAVEGVVVAIGEAMDEAASELADHITVSSCGGASGSPRAGDAMLGPWRRRPSAFDPGGSSAAPVVRRSRP